MKVTALFHMRRFYPRSVLVGGLLYEAKVLSCLREWSFVKVSVAQLSGVLLTGFDSIN